MKTQNITIYRNKQGIFVMTVQVVIFLTAFFLTTNTFAQEQEPSKEAEIKKTEIVSEEKKDIEVTSIKEENKPVKAELSKEQQQQIEELDALLKAEKITQEEYDNKKAEILGIKADIETQASKSLSLSQIEPEAQTLGRYVAPEVSTLNGSLNFSYPIVVPSGRNNLTPDLSLEYNSTNKSHSSQIATGWSLNIPYIQRVNKTGTDNLYTTDTFSSSLDGELIHQGNSIYTPRVENGAFLKYQYSNDTWKVTDKTGTVYEFGATQQARQDDPSDATRIFSWMLETVSDTNGNTINYSYYKDQGQIYPEHISYAIYNIYFNRTPKAEAYMVYNPLFKVTSNFYISQISVTANDSVVSQYDLTVSDNILKDIVITGSEGTAHYQLPPTLFEYTHEDTTNTWIGDTNWNVPTYTSGSYQYYLSSPKLVDVNGDGLTDIFQSVTGRVSSTSNKNKVYLNTGLGWIQDANYTIPTYMNGSYEYYINSPKFADVNGDGLVDIVNASKGEVGTGVDTKNVVYINTGSGWVESNTFTIPTFSPNGTDQMYLYRSQLADVNGDGLADYVSMRPGITAYQHITDENQVFLNNGTNWVYAPLWQLPRYMNGSREEFLNNPQLVDINGDGLSDIYQNAGGKITTSSAVNRNKVYLNTGSGWVEDTNYQIPTYISGSYSYFLHNPHLSDVNGDGLIDIVNTQSSEAGITHNDNKNKVYLNTGNNWVASTDFSVPTYVDSNGDINYVRSPQFTDVNGDGLIDVFSSRNVKIGTNGEVENFVAINQSSYYGNIKTLTHLQGGIKEFTYTTAQIQDANNKIGFPVNVVQTIHSDDTQGNTGITTYQYSDAYYYYKSPQDRKFAGFGTIIKTNADGSIKTTKYHQANGEQTDESVDSYTKIGKPYEQRIENALGNLFHRTRMNYTETNLGGISNSIQTASELAQHYDGTTTHTDTAISYDYDQYGNVTVQTQYGEVEGNSDGTFSDIGTDKRTSTYSYITNTSDYIVGLPTNQTLKNNSNQKEAETNYSYDAKGNLLVESQWVVGTDYADTTYSYDSYGNVLTHTNPLNHTTSYSYDTDNLYPVAVTNALSQTTNYQYDYSSGKVTLITDPNGKQIRYDYDGLDRLIEVEATVENGSREVLKDVSYHTTANPQYTKTTTYRGTDSQDVYTYTDGFGKTIQTKSEMDHHWLTLDTQYNEMGRVEKQSLPYESPSFSYSNPISNSELFTIFTYDALGRVLNTANSKGVTTTSYDGFTTSISDAENHQKDLITDAFGNLVGVREYNDGAVYTTEYQCNTQNLLTNISDAENNMRTITYDGLGRRTSLEDLHNLSDTNFGTWSYSYDDMHLTAQIDPNGSTTYYTYDGIGRVLTEDNNGTPAVDISYTYDNCSNGIGYLCSVTTPDLISNYTYLKQGLIDIESNIIDGVTYTTDTDYNWQGDVVKVTHPNASYTEYEYNTRAMTDRVKYNGTSLVTADYGVHGRPTRISHANGVTSTMSYDNSKLYELVSKVTTNGTTKFQDLNYTYDRVGNISQIIDGSDTDTAKTQEFTYDDLYRLTGVTVTNSANASDYTRNYTYSPIGNITSFNGTTYQYTDTGYSNPHAVTNIGGVSYSYDHNGNLTSDGIWTHTWDYRNRLRNSTDGIATSTYTYDHDNRRIKRIEGSDTTVYPTVDYEVHNGSVKVSLNLADTLVATDDNGIINHVHTDHLGGTNITTDTAGTITQTLDYYPYGDTRIGTGTRNESKQFTGYIKDTSTKLSYAGARYYSGKNGRFISQDPVSLRLGSDKKELERFLIEPQKLNSYSYAKNNPILYIDPNGEEPVTLLTILGHTLFAYSVAELGVNAYEISTINTYPEQFSVDEINDVQNKTLFNLVTIGIGKTLDNIDAVLFDSSIITINELDHHVKDSTVNFEKNINVSIEQNSQEFTIPSTDTSFDKLFNQQQNNPIQETTSFVKETFNNLQKTESNSDERTQTNRTNQTKKKNVK